jgi:hypothetical protein
VRFIHGIISQWLWRIYIGCKGKNLCASRILCDMDRLENGRERESWGRISLVASH